MAAALREYDVGIEPLEPGYARVRVAPRAGGGITWAKASLRTPHGVVRVSWHLGEGDTCHLDVEAPHGVEVDIVRP